jgi:hypothetical protein
MSTMNTPGAGSPQTGGENDIFTALTAVAFLFVLAATIYVGYRAVTLFGSLLPPPGS